MNQNKIDDIYFSTNLKKRVIISSNKINKNLDKILKEILVNEFEGKCVKEGYIKEDSIDIIQRSSPYLYGNQFNGNIAVDIIYRAKICCPMRGNIIECFIEKVNKLGILAVNGPLSIIIARQFHKDKTIFKDLNENKKVLAKVIDKRFNINENKISVIAELYVINKDNKKSANKNIIESENEESNNEVSENEESNNEASENEVSENEVSENEVSENEESNNEDSDNIESEDNDSEESDNEDSDFSGGESEIDQKNTFEESDNEDIDYNDTNILDDSDVEKDKYESNNESDDNLSNTND